MRTRRLLGGFLIAVVLAVAASATPQIIVDCAYLGLCWLF